MEHNAMDVHVAIITIREDEFEAVRKRFTTRLYVCRERRYLLGEVTSYNRQHYTVAITRCSEQGNDVSQQLASDIIHDLNPKLILVVGIAGGVPADSFTLGDVVVATRIVNPNVDALHADGSTEFMARGGFPHSLVENIIKLLPGEPLLFGWNTPDAIQFERPSFEQNLAIEGTEQWKEKVRSSIKRHFGTESQRYRPPRFVPGPIISSNHLVKNPTILRDWLKTNRSILAVEMESAGVYEAARTIPTYPVMSIRGISDIVGLPRDDTWLAYACHTAAAFTLALIKSDPLALREEQPIQTYEDDSTTLISDETHRAVTRQKIHPFLKGPHTWKILVLIILVLAIVSSSLIYIMFAHQNKASASYLGYNHLVFNDPLQVNIDDHQWTSSSDKNGTCLFNKGSYSVSTKALTFHYCISQYATYRDMAFEADVTIFGSGAGGLILGEQNNNFSVFNIYDDGLYSLYSYSSRTRKFAGPFARGLIKGSLVSQSDPPNLVGVTIHLAIVVHSKLCDLYINSQRLAFNKPLTFFNGFIGFIANADYQKDSLLINYNNVKVWTS